MVKQAILVIDLQNEYLSTGKLPLVGIEEAANKAAIIINDAREKGVPVIHVQHIFVHGEKPVFLPGTEGIDIQKTVAPRNGEIVVVKNKVNAFLNTNLKNVLDENGIEELIIVGAMSHMCVDAAVRAAADLGYKVVVIHDACATLDLEFEGLKIPSAYVHATLMAAFKFAYAQVISTQEYLS